MLGISEIGKNILTQGTKSMPAFGSAYTPSFGNTTYHDEFVSSHDSGGVTAKQIGLFALVGAGFAAVVALALRKPSATTVEAAEGAAESVEKIVEYRLKEDSLLKAAGGAVVGGVKAVGRGIGAVGHGIAWTAKKGVDTALFVPRKIRDAAVYVAGPETRHARKLRKMEREVELADKAEELGLEPAKKGKAAATPGAARAAGTTALDTPPADRMEHARRIYELKQELKGAQEAYKEDHPGFWGALYRLNRSVDSREPARKGIKAIKAELSQAEKDAKDAGYKLKDLKRINPEDFIEPLEPIAPAAPVAAPAPVVPAPAPAAPAPAVDIGGGI